MTVPVFIDPGLLTGICGILIGLIALLALRKHRIAAGRSHAEWSGRLERLELATQSVDDAARGGLTHSVRARALQLLQSGLSVESAASTLGIGRREMRVIAGVSRTLTLK